MTTFYDPCNDVAFKKMFQEHPQRTISFLNAVLKLKGDHRIQSVEFLPQELLPLIAESKRSILDLRVTDCRKFQYIIEVQNRYMSSYLSRVQYYASHVYVGQMRKAEDYNALKPVTVLSILHHNVFPESVPYLSFHQNKEAQTGESYMNDMAYAFVELPKFTLSYDQVKTLEDHWVFLLKGAQSLQAIPEDAPEEIKSALQVLEEHAWSEPEREAYFKVRMAMLDDVDALQSAQNKGREEGREEERIEIAQNMLKLKVDINVVVQATGLSEDKIRKILLHITP